MCHLAYLWREERIEDMPFSLRNLEKKLSKLFNSKHPSWKTYHVYKILVQTMKYEAQNRYIFPLFDQIDKANFTSKLQSRFYKQATRGFCYIYKGETGRGLRHLESLLDLFEKILVNHLLQLSLYQIG